jgi:Mor family transcriptional regulator
MTPQDISIYKAFMAGHSVGSIAKRFKLDKSQIRKVINRVSKEGRVCDTEVLLELQPVQAS